VQFFANKERTQEEFFNAFEALLAKKSHIVMTSDTYPKGLADIHERLVSRFDSGLTVAIEPPELDMRVAILINKARVEGIDMPEERCFDRRSTCRMTNPWQWDAIWRVEDRCISHQCQQLSQVRANLLGVEGLSLHVCATEHRDEMSSLD
jgi:hypothetical protein